MRRASVLRAAVGALAVVSLGCGNRLPATTYYQLRAPEIEAPATPEPAIERQVLFVEDLTVSAAYDRPEIAYRKSPYKLDYYHYHRWSAPPGELVSDYLHSAYQRSGAFARVVRDFDEDADVTLTGRILALEEVDRTEQDWIANIELELALVDNDSGNTLWSRRVSETQPLTQRNPEGLAQAISRALARVVERTAPDIAAAAADSKTSEDPEL